MGCAASALDKSLVDAAMAGDAEAVQRCLRDGADPNAADGDGYTAPCTHPSTGRDTGRVTALDVTKKQGMAEMATTPEAEAWIQTRDTLSTFPCFIGRPLSFCRGSSAISSALPCISRAATSIANVCELCARPL